MSDVRIEMMVKLRGAAGTFFANRGDSAPGHPYDNSPLDGGASRKRVL